MCFVGKKSKRNKVKIKAKYEKILEAYMGICC